MPSNDPTFRLYEPMLEIKDGRIEFAGFCDAGNNLYHNEKLGNSALCDKGKGGKYESAADVAVKPIHG